MFFEVLIFLFIGIALGVLMGLLPGIHPNHILVMIPFFLALNLEPLYLLALIVAMAVTNTVVDSIPSIIFGAPDSESALSVLPGHKLLMQGRGYEAIKLTVIGSVGSIILCVALLPILIFTIPSLYAIAKPYIFLILTCFVTLMILTEDGTKKKLLALLCFSLAGVIGLLSARLPLDKNLILFPILSGFFGLPLLIFQMKKKGKLPRQELVCERKIKKAKPIVLGSVGGIASGLLPGVGSSEIASFATIDKNDRSFLITIGAITTANILLSFLALWLIGNPRSGSAVAVEQLMTINFEKFLFIVFVAITSCALAALITLFLSKRTLKSMTKINYSLINKIIFSFIIIMIIYFTGILGLFLAMICCSLGIFVNLMKIKRGLLMGILILPTILFYIAI